MVLLEAGFTYALLLPPLLHVLLSLNMLEHLRLLLLLLRLLLRLLPLRSSSRKR